MTIYSLDELLSQFGTSLSSSNCYFLTCFSLVAQRLKRLPPMQETRVRSLGLEDPLEKEMATHSSMLAWRIPWTEELGRLQSTGSQRVGHDWVTSLSLYYFFSLWLSFFKNFYFYFILLYNAVLVLPYIDVNQPRVYMSSQSCTPLPSPYHLSGSSPCTSPKHPVSCIEHRAWANSW